jgi:hypothetical protein
VLAADSRVTLLTQQEIQGQTAMRVLPSTFDNATKLLRFSSQPYIGAVTYGLGALGGTQPRTAHSFLPEFDSELKRDAVDERLSVEAVAQRLSHFFMTQWEKSKMPPREEYMGAGEPMIFLVGGYNSTEPYGRVYDFFIPHRPEPTEQNVDTFGVTWGGQRQIVDRLLNVDPALNDILQEHFDLDPVRRDALGQLLRERLSPPIPYQFLSLQDCVDFSIFLVRTTIDFQSFQVGVRGVGGAIDVATITRTDGFKPVQQKRVRGQAREYNPVRERE